MLVGGGIGLTPCASIITALIRHRWRRGASPEILHLYWIVRIRIRVDEMFDDFFFH